MARRPSARPLVRVAAAAAAAAGLLAASAPLDPSRLEGAYHRHTTEALADGTEYGADDVLEIVATGAASAYVRTRLNFGNGHLCALHGLFQVQGSALVFHDPSPPADGPRCTLRLQVSGRQLAFDDGGGSCEGYCGARGFWEGASFPLSARRPITYLPRLKASPEYREDTGVRPAAPR